MGTCHDCMHTRNHKRSRTSRIKCIKLCVSSITHTITHPHLDETRVQPQGQTLQHGPHAARVGEVLRLVRAVPPAVRGGTGYRQYRGRI